MQHDRPVIIVFHGGTAGDLVTAVLDSRNAILDNGLIAFTDQRSELKNNRDSHYKLDWLSTEAKQYGAVPSHAEELHVAHNHRFLLVTALTHAESEWAAIRLAQSLIIRERASIALDLAATSQAIRHYSETYLPHAEHTVSVNDIRHGKLIERLQLLYPHIVCDDTLYVNWIRQQAVLDTR